ncbi:MAG TPA: methyltransferase domain-containing protein [Burkholderiales bacterium]|nr:methyltransferase domain-containing protein [Burkholderiales bacterium]
MRQLLAFALGVAAAAAPAQETEWQPPFITTPPEVVERMLALARTGPGDLVVDLGSGDGRIVIAAARQFGARGLGIELDGELVEKSRRAARAAGVADKVSFVQGDVLVADISRASVVTVYLLPALMAKLQSRFIEELAPGTRIVSHAFAMAGWSPDAAETVKLGSRHPGQGDESRLHLWIVPADARGVWRGPGVEVRIEQNYQSIEVLGAGGARLSGREIAWDGFKGRVEGNRIVGELAGRTIELRRR